MFWCDYFGGMVLFSLMLVFILIITRSVFSNEPRKCFKLTMGASSKNRLAGFVILLAAAGVVWLLKLCPPSEAWVEGVINLTTGFSSALAAIFFNEGFIGFRDEKPGTVSAQQAQSEPTVI